MKQELDEHYLADAKGAQIRSRVKYIEEGERSTKFFLGLEKKRQKCNQITSLKIEENVYNSDEDLLKIAANFYDELYKSKKVSDHSIDEYLSNLNIENTLSQRESKSLDGRISYKECDKIVSKLKQNKSPGLDGLPAEFYQKIWHKIRKLIVDSFNESYEEKQLSESQRMAVITLIFKKGDAQLLTNYRPISLTNTDYKILAFCLANRLQNVITSIIDPGQVAYIKERYIGCNIRLIEDICELYEHNNKGAVLMMLDFQKAFDSLEWNFMYKALKMFNIGDSFIQWIQTLYSDPMACIKNNGYLSRGINLERSVRQGCPVS